jgi:hypothetical protein
LLSHHSIMVSTPVINTLFNICCALTSPPLHHAVCVNPEFTKLTVLKDSSTLHGASITRWRHRGGHERSSQHAAMSYPPHITDVKVWLRVQGGGGLAQQPGWLAMLWNQPSHSNWRTYNILNKEDAFKDINQIGYRVLVECCMIYCIYIYSVTRAWWLH